MGCLNSDGHFDHYFGNIHLSGPCNRSCYFCIGQHMMALDSFNNLDEWPLKGIEEFVERCNARGITEVNVTGSNTDPFLYKHTKELAEYLREHIPGLTLGVRTNGVLVQRRPDIWNLYDKASISLTSLNPDIYRETMGNGWPPDIKSIVLMSENKPLKVNVVLCPETIQGPMPDLNMTILGLFDAGITKINLREPYGQPHIGDPLAAWEYGQSGTMYGMPVYPFVRGTVVYWDVHFVEVESVNLYANGVVSETYPVTKGHDPVYGLVQPQSEFKKSGRQFEQWLTTKK